MAPSLDTYPPVVVEWKQTYPAYPVDIWLGDSEQVSNRHYMMVPDDHYQRAATSAPAGSGNDSQHATNE